MSDLLEREEEHLVIAALLRRVAAGGMGGALFLRGEPGLGKTRLLELAADQAEDRFTVVRASGHEMEQAYPFAVVHQLLESLLRSAGTIAADLASSSDSLRLLLRESIQTSGDGPGSGESPARSGILYALYWLLGSLAERRPLLLSLDDIHWCDPDSLEAIRFLAWRVANLPIALIAALRPWPPAAGRLAERLQAGNKAGLLGIRPLSAEGTARLLQTACGGSQAESSVAAAHVLTGGNPFLVEQLGQIMKSGDRLPEVDAVPAIPGRAVVLARLSGLPAESLQFLLVASVLGVECRLEVALELAGIDPASSSAVLAPAQSLGLFIAGEAGNWGFVHPLLRRALYDSLDPAEREQLHLRLANVLRARGARATEVAPHLAKAARPGDLAAVEELHRAATEAWALSAYDSAAIHLGHAARLSNPGPGRARALHELGRAHQRAGSHQLAVEAFAAAAAEACPPTLRCRIHQSWGLSLALSGNSAMAVEQLDQAIAAVQASDLALAAETAAARTVLEVTTRGMAVAERSALESLRLAEESGAALAQAKAMAAWSQVTFLRGDYRTAQRFAREANARLPESAPDEIEQLWGWCPRIQLGMVDMRTERYDEAAAVMRYQLEQAEARHVLPARIWAATFLAEIEWRRGRLRDAFRWCGGSAAYPEDIPWATAQAHLIQGYVLMEMDDLDGAEACFVRAQDESQRAGLGAVHLTSAWGRATLAARRGALDVAAEEFRRLVGVADRLDLVDSDFFHSGREAAEVFVHTGAYSEALRMIRKMLAAAPATDRPGLRSAAFRCLGLLEARRGRGAAAEQALTASLALYAQADEELERGRTLLAYGSWLRRTGEPKRARSLLGEAAAVFERCGGKHWQRIAEAERRSAGGRGRAQSRNGQLSSLTPQEYRIVELVAQGYANRQIAYQLLVSPKTLETHLRHVYDKLGVSSRLDLKATFIRQAPNLDPQDVRESHDGAAEQFDGD